MAGVKAHPRVVVLQDPERDGGITVGVEVMADPAHQVRTDAVAEAPVVDIDRVQLAGYCEVRIAGLAP